MLCLGTHCPRGSASRTQQKLHSLHGPIRQAEPAGQPVPRQSLGTRGLATIRKRRLMFWLFSAGRRLRELGILGMNRRNATCILDHNPRARYPLVDDKLRMHDLCRLIGVTTPRLYTVIRSFSMLRRLPDVLPEPGDFVIKPNRGSAGRGVLVLVGRKGSY